MGKPALGTGERFERLKAKLAHKGARTPGALAAWIGRRKYGKERFAELAAEGRKRAAVRRGIMRKRKKKKEEKK